MRIDTLHQIRWAGFAGPTLIMVALLSAGCASDQTALACSTSCQLVPHPRAASAATGAESPAQARLQMAEGEAQRQPIRQTVFESVKDPFAGPTEGQVTLKIRAHVNGFPVFDEEVKNACFPYLLQTRDLQEPERSARQAEIVKRELERIIEQELVLQDFRAKFAKKPQQMDKLTDLAAKECDKQVSSMKKRAKLKTDAELKELLRSQNLTMEGYRRQFIRNFLSSEYMRFLAGNAVDKIGIEQIREYYQQHINEFQTVDSVKWQDIFVDAGKYQSRDEARHVAEKLVADARQGQDFLKLSAQYDNGDSQYRKGDGFGQRRGEIKPEEAEPVLFNMKDGEIGPIVELTNGFHVIRLVKRDYAGQTPLTEKIQAEIRKKLQNEATEREIKRVLAKMKSNATIEVAN